MGPYLRPEVTAYTHNPLSLTASYQAASHANAGVPPTRSQAGRGWRSDCGEISKTRRKNRVTQTNQVQESQH